MATASRNGNDRAGVLEVQLRSIPLAQIVVREDFNPRGHVAEDAELHAMAETMRQCGCLQPIRVRVNDAGDYELIAGERRYRAAALAALTEIPASVISGEVGDDVELLVEAMIENELRSDLDTVQRARGYQAMIDGGLSVRGVAERLGGKSKRVSRERRIKEHLPILELPGQLQTLVGEQKIPLLAVRTLLDLAAIHDEFAHAAVSAVHNDEDDEAGYSWQEVIDAPIEIATRFMQEPPDGVFTTRSAYPIEQFTLSEKAQKDLAAYTKLTDGGEISCVRFSGELVTQAKLLGAVHEAGWFSLIVGNDVADRLAEDYIANVLKEQRANKRRERNSTPADENRSSSPDDAMTEVAGGRESEAERIQRKADEAKAVRVEQQLRREQATTFNLELGLLAFKHLPKIKVDERVLRILASVDLAGSLRKIATRGARLALPGWMTQTQQRNQKTKTTYLDTWEVERKAAQFLDGAESAGDIAGRAVTLIALAGLADEAAVAQSTRSYYELAFAGPWAKQAARDLNAIVRERIKEGQLPALDVLLADRIAKDAQDAEREAAAEQAQLRVQDASARLTELSEDELEQLQADTELAWGEFSPKRYDICTTIEAERKRREQQPAGEQPASEPELTQTAG